MDVNAALDTHDFEAIEPPLPMQRMAWVILVSAFLLFCSSSVALTGGMYYFLFHSDVPMPTQLQAGRGTAVVVDKNFNESSVRSNSVRWMGLLDDRPSLVRTDTQSQAVLSFQLPTDVTIATVTLDNSTQVQFERADMPRFEWSEGRYALELADVQGRVEIFVSNALERGFRLQIETDSGVQALFDEPGRYTLEVGDDQVRLISRHGQAVLVAPDHTNNRLVTSGQEVVMIAGRNQPAMPTPRQNLLENGLFAFDIPSVADVANAENPVLPAHWGCSKEADEPPSSTFTMDIWEGRPAWRLLRGDNASSHGETRCRQEFAGEQGINVQEYSYLELTTTFMINHQSLSECGQAGSECPMMVQIDYYDQYADDLNEDLRSWYQGFYYRYDAAYDAWPPRCESGCLQDHRRINSNVWYTFRSGNLLDSLPEDPSYIKRVVFYASGHQYDIFVSEMALLAGASEIVPPDVIPSDALTTDASSSAE